MSLRTMWRLASIVLIAGLGLTACGPRVSVPDPDPDKFSVAMVLIGPKDDHGWSQAHYEGLEYVAQQIPGVQTVYIENVPEGDESEPVIRALAAKGFDLIFATSFGFMDQMERVANEFPNTYFIHISGTKSNTTNFGNLMGAMETAIYLAGMLAGERAEMDGNLRLGYMATYQIAEELRLGNAFALGMRKTCSECTMDVRWLNTWHDPVVEKRVALEMFDAGAQVVLSGADTPAVADAAEVKGKWGVTFDWVGSCTSPACLTAPYWNWGPVYKEVVEGLMNKTYKPGWHYFDGDSGGLGLYGFMPGQELTVGAAELPGETLNQVRALLRQMQEGGFNRFNVFQGPITDNKGNIIVADGYKLEQIDLDQFPEMQLGCKVCMKWWSAGVNADWP